MAGKPLYVQEQCSHIGIIAHFEGIASTLLLDNTMAPTLPKTPNSGESCNSDKISPESSESAEKEFGQDAQDGQDEEGNSLL